MTSDDTPRGTSSARIERWMERHDDRHDRERAELRGELEQVEMRLMERMTVLEKRQVADHQSNVQRTDKIAETLDAIQSTLDQQRGAKNLILAIGIGTLINVALMVVAVYQGVLH